MQLWGIVQQVVFPCWTSGGSHNSLRVAISLLLTPFLPLLACSKRGSTKKKKEYSMFLIWRGWGLLLPLGVFAGAFIGFLVSGSLLGPQSGLAPVIISLFATIGAYGVVALLGRTDKGKVVIDKDSGEELLLKRGDRPVFHSSSFLVLSACHYYCCGSRYQRLFSVRWLKRLSALVL